MKRSLSTLMYGLMVILLCTSHVYAQDFSKKELKEMTAFAAAFAESGIWNFDVEYAKKEMPNTFIYFAVNHILHKHPKTKVTYKGNMAYIDEKFVRELTKKYFQYDFTNPKGDSVIEYKDGKFITNMDDYVSQSKYMRTAKVTKARRTSDGTIEMIGEMCDFHTGESFRQPFLLTVEIHQIDGKNTWIATSMRTLM